MFKTRKKLSKNINGNTLKKCSTSPITGYTRNGFCDYENNDFGKHLVCAEMNKGFLDYTENKGNPLRNVVKEGDRWCICEDRYKQAFNDGMAPRIVSESTNSNVRNDIQTLIRSQKGGKTKKKTNKQFFYNPNDPKKSFDVYIDKNPNDTISIKYSTVSQVKETIKKLEMLYKRKVYPHKRIWQVAMIMKVRLEQLRSKKPKQYSLSKRYYDFLKKRTKQKESDRKKMLFKV